MHAIFTCVVITAINSPAINRFPSSDMSHQPMQQTIFSLETRSPGPAVSCDINKLVSHNVRLSKLSHIFRSLFFPFSFKSLEGTNPVGTHIYGHGFSLGIRYLILRLGKSKRLIHPRYEMGHSAASVHDPTSLEHPEDVAVGQTAEEDPRA